MSSQWIFGYGSLVWRPAFAFLEAEPAYVEDWTRRFWQASPDHRGTEAAPGRVVTLVPAPGERCWGMAYRIADADADAIVGQLDHREKAGYEQVRTALHLRDGRSVTEVLFYVAAAGNANYVETNRADEIIEVIRRAHGPSGSNREYLLKLGEALAAMKVEDPHVGELIDLL